MTLIANLGLFVAVFLPVVALVAMGLEGLLGPASPEWRVGWNPLLWLLWTAPWHVWLILLVPLLHWVGRAMAAARGRHTARATLLTAAPLLFAVAMRGFYGPGNGGMDVLLPVLIAGLAFGAVARIPGAPKVGLARELQLRHSSPHGHADHR